MRHVQFPREAVAAAAPADTAHARYLGTRHFASLNGLRFLCIAAVLWHHGPVWTGMENAPRIVARGFLGVDMFFVLSGFLITTLLLREARAKGRFSLRGFYWRRALRILPVYLLVVTALCVFYIGVQGETHHLAAAPFYYLFLANFITDHVPNLAPMWSLSVEEQFYMLWPLALLILPRQAILPAVGALVVVNLAAVTDALRPLGIVAFDAGPLRFEMFNATYAPILIGAGLALVLDERRGYGVIWRVLGWRFAPIATFAALLALLFLLPGSLIGWPNLALHLIMAGCLASIVLREDHAARPVLSWRPVAYIGEISYGLYLYHLIGLHIVNTALPRLGLSSEGDLWVWAVLLLYSGLSIVMAAVSFRYYETPFLALRYPRPPGQAQPVPG